MTKLLIVEDDLELNHALGIYFEKAGYRIWQAFTEKEAEEILTQKEVDVVIADIGLSDASGLRLAKIVQKERKIPLIFLTAKDEERDILDGYDAGCEEYVVKPVSPKVLEKKLETILRRNEEESCLCYKGLTIAYEKRRVWKDGIEIKITDKEWKVLYVLAKNRGKIITKEILLEKVWGIEGNFVDEHVISVVVNRIRKKLENKSENAIYIKNVFGVGYTFGDN